MRGRAIVTLLGILWAYECLAIFVGCWPTFTALIRPHREVGWVFWTGIGVIAFVATLTAVHLFGDRGGW